MSVVKRNSNSQHNYTDIGTDVNTSQLFQRKSMLFMMKNFFPGVVIKVFHINPI